MTDDESAVRGALTALDTALERGDLETILDLCAEAMVFIGSGEDEEAVGRDGIAAMLKRIAPKLKARSSTSRGNLLALRSSGTSRSWLRGAARLW